MGIFIKQATGLGEIDKYIQDAQDQEVEFAVPDVYVEPQSKWRLKEIVANLVCGVRRNFSTIDIPLCYERPILSNALNIDLSNPTNPIHGPQAVKVGVTINLPNIATSYQWGVREIFVLVPGQCYICRITFPGTVNTTGVILHCIYDNTKTGSGWIGWGRWESVNLRVG